MKLFKEFKKYTKGFKVKLYCYSILYFLAKILNVLVPLITGVIIDVLTTNKEWNKIVKYTSLFVVISILILILTYITDQLFIKLQTSIAFTYNMAVLDHIKSLNYSFFWDKDSVYLNQKINNDTNDIVTFCLQNIIDIISNFFIAIFTMIYLFKISLYIIIFIIILSIIYYVLYEIIKDKIYQKNYNLKEAQSKFFSTLNEQLDKIKFIKIHSLNKQMNKKLKTVFKNVIKTAKDYQIYNSIFNILENFIMIIADVFIYLLCGYNIINGNISLGVFIVVLNYYNKYMSTIKYFFIMGKDYQEVNVAYNRIVNLLKLEEEVFGNVIIDKIERIMLQNITFKYNEEIIIRDFTFSFNIGNVYGVIGDNGTGKSTLIDILLGIYNNLFYGDLWYNDINIHDIHIAKLRTQNICITEQSPMFLSDNFPTNILLEDRALNKYEIIEITQFLNIFNLRYDSMESLTESDFCNLSGGEQKKLCLIRTLIKDADVLIFDEPTASLDEKSRQNFWSIIKSIKNNKIIIIISHDIEITVNSDIILNLNEINRMNAIK